MSEPLITPEQARALLEADDVPGVSPAARLEVVWQLLEPGQPDCEDPDCEDCVSGTHFCCHECG